MPPLDINTIIKFLNSAPRPEIKLVVSENGDKSIGIYGQRRTSQKVASAVFRFELQSDPPDDSGQLPPQKRTTLKSSVQSKSSQLKGSKPVGHVNNVAELRQNSASYSIKMSTSLSGESSATQLRKERSLNV